MFISILGRQPEIGFTELEQIYGAAAVESFTDAVAVVNSDNVDINRLGGSLKVGRVVAQVSAKDWRDVSKQIVQHYLHKWRNIDHKITLGISAYNFNTTNRDVQQTGILLKKQLKQSGVSLRMIPNAETALNTATSHHNKLGLSDNKVELLVIHNQRGEAIIAQSTGAQNITAIAARDQARPKTDAFVGMLPPKLALMMVNMTGLTPSADLRILDPFCGTGVVLQEAALLGFTPYGSDLSEKMVDFSNINMQWLNDKYQLNKTFVINQADAMEAQWQQPIGGVVAETYLGQPFSAPPSAEKLREVRGNCNHIIGEFLHNLAPQLKSGTPLVLAVPAWRDSRGQTTHLPLIANLETFGYKQTNRRALLYYRETQVVARQILILTKK